MQSFVKNFTFKRFIILLIIIILALPVIKSVFFEEKSTVTRSGNYEYSYIRGDEYSMNKILKVPVNGIILTEETGVAGPLEFLSDGMTYGYSVKETLRRASEDESIKGILLTVNSPGGTIPGSQAISDGIKLYKDKTGNPVYAHIRDTGASGAYWASVATDKIFIDTGSLVGSIGVIMGPFTYYDGVIEEGSILGGVTTEGGIEHTYITGGQYKDTGSPYRQMTPEETAHWQSSIDDEYSTFVDHVSVFRNLDPAFLRTTVKALPYNSTQALELGLVDEIGNEDTALFELAQKAGIGDDFQLLQEKSKADLFGALFSAFAPETKPSASHICNLCNTPLYLYDRTYSIYKQ